MLYYTILGPVPGGGQGPTRCSNDDCNERSSNHSTAINYDHFY